VSSLPLGKEIENTGNYTPSLLCAIERRDARDAASVPEPLPFLGEDVWNCYELTWLDTQGMPQISGVRIQAPCSTPCIVESKSLKLYLNSFAQTQFASRSDVMNTLDSDLSVNFRAPVMVSLLGLDQLGNAADQFPGICLDELDIATHYYDVNSSLLTMDDSEVHVHETLFTHLFRSICPVTGQPDLASVMVEYSGSPINQASLLKYLVSYRNHPAFHEATIEQIFVDIKRICQPDQLTVYGRFLRRGGIDINPFRSTQDGAASQIRLSRQ